MDLFSVIVGTLPPTIAAISLLWIRRAQARSLEQRAATGDKEAERKLIEVAQRAASGVIQRLDSDVKRLATQNKQQQEEIDKLKPLVVQNRQQQEDINKLSNDHQSCEERYKKLEVEVKNLRLLLENK